MTAGSTDRWRWRTKEVTVEQIREFDEDHRQESPYGDETGCAAINVSWFQAVRYCNWLSEQAGIDRSQWCYPETTGPALTIPEDASSGTDSASPRRPNGNTSAGPVPRRPGLMASPRPSCRHYAWTWLNSGNRARAAGLAPAQQFGIFDAMGNVWEWCQDGPAGAYPDVPKPPYPHGTPEHPATDPGRTETVDLDVHGQQTWRILRGGSFRSAPETSRAAHRDWGGALDRLSNFGFRIVRTLPPEDTPAKRSAVGGGQ